VQTDTHHRKPGNLRSRSSARWSRVAAAHGAINLAQGFPDFPAPDAIKQAAAEAIFADHNQYAITWGTKDLREAIAAKLARDYDIAIDPERQITVCCGSTEGMIASLMATVDPGDEVIVFEPFYENYGADAVLCGATPRYVRMHAPDFRLDYDELAAAFNDRTRAIIINTPHNPSGKVFSRDELNFIAGLCVKHDVLAITDEIYEHILYDGAEHVPIWKLPGMAERTLIVNSISKTYSVTGWRIGYVVASPEITASVRKVHDFLTVGAAAPLQVAAAKAMRFPLVLYRGWAILPRAAPDFYNDAVRGGPACFKPQGGTTSWPIYGRSAARTTSTSPCTDQENRWPVVPGSCFYCAGSAKGAN
jgi:aminotransferase